MPPPGSPRSEASAMPARLIFLLGVLFVFMVVPSAVNVMVAGRLSVQ